MNRILNEKEVKAEIDKTYKKMGCTSYSVIVDMRVVRPLLKAQAFRTAKILGGVAKLDTAPLS